MQTSLSIYQELAASGYIQNHKQAILTVLSDFQEHSTEDIAKAGGKQYNARVLELRSELRARGMDIISVRNGMSFGFRLVRG